MGEDELNPQATGLTTKEVLLEVRHDVKAMAKDVAILTSQELDNRVNALESWADRVNGRVNALIVLVSVVGGVVGIAVALRVLFPVA